MAVKVIKVGFLGLNVVNADAMGNHYENVLGLPRSADSGKGEAVKQAFARQSKINETLG